MSRKEELAREQLVISLGICLRIWPKNERQFYARAPMSRRAVGVEKSEVAAVTAMTDGLAKRFEPFALFLDDTPHHWQIARPTVRQALVAIPLDLRGGLVKSHDVASSEIAQRIFDAVDREFRLVPLPAISGLNGGPGWDHAFEKEYGSRPTEA